MDSGLYWPNRKPSDQDKALLASAHPCAAVLRQPDHTTDDYNWAKAQGVTTTVVVVDPEVAHKGKRADGSEQVLPGIAVHYEDVMRASLAFPGAILQLSNEPDAILGMNLSAQDKNDARWNHRWYLYQVLAHQNLYPNARLIAPPLTCRPDIYQQQAHNWLDYALGTDSLRRVYSLFSAISVHVYAYWNAADLLAAVEFYHSLFPQKPLYITEYGIDGLVDSSYANQPNKVARYREFITRLRTAKDDAGNLIYSYVEMAAMFICGVPPLNGGFGHYIVGSAVSGLSGAYPIPLPKHPYQKEANREQGL